MKGALNRTGEGREMVVVSPDRRAREMPTGELGRQDWNSF